jgi:hypothetical protein
MKKGCNIIQGSQAFITPKIRSYLYLKTYVKLE